MIDEIISREWDFFQQVQNIDGRASCQDDFETFYIMRSSQFQAWNEELVTSYLQDLKEYARLGQNPIYQKYGIMMASNDPSGYLKIKDTICIIDQQKQSIIEEIIKIQLQWKLTFNQQYPDLAAMSRLVYSTQDTKEETSFETYLRGELSTYLDTTLYLYGRMIVTLMQQEKNLTTMIMKNTITFYEHASLPPEKKKPLL